MTQAAYKINEIARQRFIGITGLVNEYIVSACRHMVMIIDVDSILAKPDLIVRGYSESFLFAETKARARQIAISTAITTGMAKK